MATFGNMKYLWDWFQYWSGTTNQYRLGIARIEDGIFRTDCNGIIKMFGYARNNPAAVPGKYDPCPNYREGLVLDEWIGAWYDKASRKGNIDTIPTSGFCLVYIDNTQKHPGRWNHVGLYNAATRETFEMCTVGIRKMPLDITYWNKWSDLYWCPNVTESAEDVVSKPSTPVVDAGAPYRVRRSWADAKSQLNSYDIKANMVRCVDANHGYFGYDKNGTQVYPAVISVPPVATFTPYMVRIASKNIYIRKGAGYTSGTVRVIAPGSYTIVDVQNGFGKLKSGAGWIPLSGTTRV